jgi:hypothetical protein
MSISQRRAVCQGLAHVLPEVLRSQIGTYLAESLHDLEIPKDRSTELT